MKEIWLSIILKPSQASLLLLTVNSLIRITVAYADDNFKPVLLNQERFLNKTNMKEKQNPGKENCSFNHNQILTV
jgi:hypothetical protein